MGCFPTGGRRPKSPPPPGAYEEGSTSAGSTSVTGSPPSSASTSSPAFLDEAVEPLYPDMDGDAPELADAAGGSLSAAIATRRLFLAPPGRSNSIVDSSEHAAAMYSGGSPSQRATDRKESETEAVRSVSMSTAAPRAEFLKSMLEMAEALGLDPRRGGDRARLHELLLCYIALNDSDTLRDILGAFTELLCLLNNATTGDNGAAAERATHRS
ncbi:transcription repressor OFP16 [Brachypodium distachyon]|nr:transcription repressor OFP16 [Brachypodium distachyon]|eukprot:XP_010236590.2 transcription repressor OFP16 [Brachypodium distachyon]